MDINLENPKADNISSRNDLYQKMIEEIQDYAIILLDTDGIIRNWNKGAEKIKGYSENEIIGKHFSIFYLKEYLDAELPNRLIKEARETGRAVQEGWRKRKDQTRFWGSITITAIHDEENNVIGFSKVTRDLTDKKSAEDNLRMSEERYHKMIAEVQDYAIILLNAYGTIENWNAGAENIKGYKADEIIGRKFDIFYSEEDRKAGLPYQLLDKAREAGKATHEGYRVRKDGTKFWGSVVITALHGKNNEIIGFSKVTRDLTQQKIASGKLAAYTAELEIQNSELEQFAYVASHDLQEPLRKIRTFAELIKDNYDNKEFVEEYFDKLDLSAKRMSELIKSLLDYSRVTKGTHEGEGSIGYVDLNLVVEDAKQDFELLINEKNATVLSEPLPSVTGNRIQLGQLFSNLISNGLKFSDKEPVIKISSTTKKSSEITNAPRALSANEYYCISFRDKGIGFDNQYSQKIFSLFQRLHGKQDYTGTGIGLALCKKIAENHNGFIDATGELGRGATFNVYLPVS